MSARVLCVANFETERKSDFLLRKGALIFERISQSCSSSQEELLLLRIISSSYVTLSLPECIVVRVVSWNLREKLCSATLAIISTYLLIRCPPGDKKWEGENVHFLCLPDECWRNEVRKHFPKRQTVFQVGFSCCQNPAPLVLSFRDDLLCGFADFQVTLFRYEWQIFLVICLFWVFIDKFI